MMIQWCPVVRHGHNLDIDGGELVIFWHAFAEFISIPFVRPTFTPDVLFSLSYSAPRSYHLIGAAIWNLTNKPELEAIR